MQKALNRVTGGQLISIQAHECVHSIDTSCLISQHRIRDCEDCSSKLCDHLQSEEHAAEGGAGESCPSWHVIGRSHWYTSARCIISRKGISDLNVYVSDLLRSLEMRGNRLPAPESIVWDLDALSVLLQAQSVLATSRSCGLPYGSACTADRLPRSSWQRQLARWCCAAAGNCRAASSPTSEPSAQPLPAEFSQMLISNSELFG